MNSPQQPPVVIHNNVYAPPPAVYVSSGCNHAVHAVLTLLTCGAWLPIWIICAVVDGGGATAAHTPAPYNPAFEQAVLDWRNPTQVRRQPALPVLIAVVAVLGGVLFGGLLLLIAMDCGSPISVVCCGVLLVVGGVGYWFWRHAQDRRSEQDEIVARADAEYQANLRGGPAGIYGQFPPAPIL
jgi:hypothetical protein